MTEKEKVVQLTEKEMTPMEQFDQWLKELVFPGKVKDFIEEVSGGTFPTEIRREVCFYTENYAYYIEAYIKHDGSSDYIGCQVNARKSRAGEDWTRGNDLPDGPLNKETWNRIVYAIVNYELVALSPFRKPDKLPEDAA